MSENRECKECGENAVVLEENYMRCQLICQACGAVISEDSFNENEKFFNVIGAINSEVNTLPWHMQRKGRRSKTKGLKHGEERIGYLAAAFNLPSYMTDGAINLYTEVIRLPEFLKLQATKKGTIAACCVYIVLRQNDWPITKCYLCEVIHSPLSLFQELLSTIIFKNNIEIKSTPLEELVPFFVDKLNLDDQEVICQKTVSLLQVASCIWTSRSRAQEPFIAAAIFMVWISLDYSSRIKTTAQKFIQNCGLNLSHGVLSSRFAEIRKLLMELAESIPWLEKQKINKKTVIYYLSDILRYSKSLLRERLEKLSKDLEEEPEPEKQTPCPVETVVYSEERLKALNSEELSEKDIPDEDLGMYIRSDEEISAIKKFMNNKRKCDLISS